jgi:hypothetical protein
MALTQMRDDNDETFWQRLVLPEEERQCLFPETARRGGYRWFRSPNVVPIEQWRRRKQEQERA